MFPFFDIWKAIEAMVKKGKVRKGRLENWGQQFHTSED
jgi:hypothetical protein